MKTIRLGRTEKYVSVISLGTWAYGGSSVSNGSSVGWTGQNDKDSRLALLKAYENGINHWDTADVYGDGRSETIIGSVWNDVPRGEIFLATKTGWDSGPYDHFYHPKHMRNQIEKSLKNLKTDTVDLFYLHHCHFGKNSEYFDDALDSVIRFKEEGKTRFVGLSDWNSDLIMKYIDLVNPDVVQPYRNVRDSDYEKSGLRRWINSNDAGVCFFSPLKHGLLTGKYDVPTKFPEGDWRSGVRDFQDAAVIDLLKKNKGLMSEKFKDHPDPVMHGLVDTLLTDSPTGCVLLGQRNISQVEAASVLGKTVSPEDAEWVFSIYRAS